MCKYLYPLATTFFFMLLEKAIMAQCTVNYLLNPSFEAPVQSNNNGNNFPAGATFNNWTATNIVPATPNPWNILRVDGSGYFGGPNSAQQGLQYADVNSAAGKMEQNFNLGCTADITFSGYFSSREANGYVDWTAQIVILNSSNIVVATSSTRLFTVADADNNPGDAIWYQLSGTATSLPAGSYKFSAVVGNYGNFDNAFLCALPGCLLPVKLTSFGAELENCTTNLKWSVETESNFNKYIIEYSLNSIDFSDAGVVNGAGQGFPRNYSFQHIPNAGKSFYRLKMVDIDGRISYSKVIALNINCNENMVLVYPNPVTDFLNINISNVSTGSVVSVSLYNTQGQLVLKKKLINGTNAIDMRSMPSGMYSIQIFSNDIITTYKVSK